MNNKFTQKLKSLPKEPGIYMYRNDKGQIIYVGKAVSLKDRVSSYFRGDHDIKTEELVQKIADIEWIVAGSEVEALLLEAELIKRYKPHYNIDWKDDKNYCYIKVTNEDYPRIYIVRQVIDDRATYLGPYIDANAVRLSLKTLRKVFPFCTCTLNPDSTCLYYHLNLCHGHGPKYISKSDYQANIRGLINFINGKHDKVLQDFHKKMKAYAAEKKFELAAEIRDRIEALSKVRFQHVIEEKREVGLDKALTGLRDALNLSDVPHRIECYDISNIFGRAAVGSMVVFRDGVPDKNDYRRFEIKTVKRIDDFAMHQEVQKRRFKNLEKQSEKSFSKIPDLVIIDGGKGQLSSVLEIVRPFGLPTKFIGLAKRLEELVLMDDRGNFSIVNLEPNSEAFFLVQRIRDEAHRFAITYHRNLRSKELTSSKLDNVPGIGPKTKKKLVTRFGSVDKIREASEKDLIEIVNKKIVQNLREYL